MKTPSFLLLILLLPLWAGAAAGPAPATVFHDLEVTLNPAAGTLVATDRLTLGATVEAFLPLRLAPSVSVTSVRRAGAPLPWRQAGGVLTVGPLAPAGAALTLEIAYHGRFADPVPVAPLNNEDPTYGVATAITPQGAFLSGGTGWYPEVAGSEARFRLRVQTPPGVWAVAAGRLVERRESAEGNSIVWETDQPLPDLTLAAGPWLIREERVGTIPIYTFFGAGNAPLASTYLEETRAALDRYQQLFGPYPFEKFAVVENFFPTGYGFPSWTLLGSSVVRLPFITTTSLHHEIAHSWWGTGVRVDRRFGNWSEGLTTYVADYLNQERVSPAAAGEYRLKILRDYGTLVTATDDYPLARFQSRRSKGDQAIGYGKSAMIFHMARRRVGDEAFWGGLRKVARERMFREAAWSDFAKAFDPDDNLKMTEFFRRWVEEPGAPVLTLTGVSSRPRGGGWEVTARLRQEPPYFPLQLPLRLDTAGAAITRTLSVEEAETAILMTAPERPLGLAVDPDTEVFRRLEPGEIPPTVNTLRGARSLLVVLADLSPPSLRRVAGDLLTGLAQTGRIVTEREALRTDLTGQTLVLIGWPGHPALRPVLPKGLAVDATGFTLNGERFAAAGDVLFATLPAPPAQAAAAGLFLAPTPTAAEVAVRKLPHYGKYSYLAFSDGANRVKGTWPPTRSPLVHRFPQTP